MSYGLTQRIAEEIDANHGRYLGTTQALHAAIGAMVAHDTARGKSAFAGIDVERLFSAVQMLSQRDDVELTPFVASWNGALEAASRSQGMPSFFRRNFAKELTGNSDSSFERTFKQGVEAVVGRSSDPVFSTLERQMVSVLRQVLAVDPAAVDYLAPLLDASESPVQIATLNYDRTVESVAERAGRTVDTGIENWSGGFDWSWSDSSNVRLLKLHGSIDWWQTDVEPRDGSLVEQRIQVAKDMKGGGFLGWSGGPRLALVFGQRGKVRAEGPFLAMLRAFDDFLARSRHLVVVGYSFRDEHINGSIRRWYNRTTNPQLTIVDPALASFRRWDDARPKFLSQLLGAVMEPPTVTAETKVREPHTIIASPASSALQECFGPGPQLAAPLPPEVPDPLPGA